MLPEAKFVNTFFPTFAYFSTLDISQLLLAAGLKLPQAASPEWEPLKCGFFS